LPKLDTRDLQVVLAVAAVGSTAKAAGVLHLSQSAVSRALVLAEGKLGVPLFERRARGLAPTAAGRQLIDGATPLLAQLGALEQEVAGAAHTPVRLRLVCECYTAYRWLGTTLTRLRERMPGLEIELAVEHSRDPVAALTERAVDIALLTTMRVRGGLRERPLFSDEIVFVLAADHPLARRSALTPDDLRATTLLGSSNNSRAEARGFFSRIYGPVIPKLHIVRLPLTDAIVDMARAGLGIAILSEWVASGYLDTGDLVVKRLISGPVRRPWRIAYRREAEAPAALLAATLDGTPPRLRIPAAAPRRPSPGSRGRPTRAS
jgi:LysR family transcriptional regulator for metE and metH